MKLLDVYINGFGKFHDRSVVFHDGLNIVYGKNEAGKTRYVRTPPPSQGQRDLRGGGRRSQSRLF